MTKNSGSPQALASLLRSWDDERLHQLLTAREIRDAGIKDFFDLAEQLLEPASIDAALSRLDRAALTTLAVVCDLRAKNPSEADVAARLRALGALPSALGDHLSSLVELALIGRRPDPDSSSARYTAPDTVVAQLRSWPAIGLPSLEELAGERPRALAQLSSIDATVIDHRAAERAFATTMAIVELVAEHEREPTRELARGGVALPDSKRLAAAASVELEAVQRLHAIAARANLLALDGMVWRMTDSAADWAAEASVARWARLAGAWLERLPVDLRTVLGGTPMAMVGERFDDLVDWLYPAGGDVMRERVGAYTHDADLLGIITDHIQSTPGALLLSDGPEAAAEAMAALFPAEVSKVYLQHDLSIVSPGPLVPSIDARLRTIARVESRALAASYRVSPASINNALAAGETADSITRFLSEISLTGIPQPLSYVIADAAQRYGAVRVGSVHEADSGPSARSYIRSTDSNLLDSIAVDHSLSALGLSAAGPDRLESRAERDTVFWMLADAKYPVAAEDASGDIIALQRRRGTAPGAAQPKDHAQTIVERLRLLSYNAAEETGKAWIERQLEIAIREKLTVAVTITMPDGQELEYVLEPTGLAGGRLRARDRKADIERTLPLSHITAIDTPA